MDLALRQACLKYMTSLCLHKKARPCKEQKLESLGPKLSEVTVRSWTQAQATRLLVGTAFGTALLFVNVFKPLTLQRRVWGQEGGDY